MDSRWIPGGFPVDSRWTRAAGTDKPESRFGRLRQRIGVMEGGGVTKNKK
jgi:hypothetical protein